MSRVKLAANLSGGSQGVGKDGRRWPDEHGGMGSQGGRGIRGRASEGRWEIQDSGVGALVLLCKSPRAV